VDKIIMENMAFYGDHDISQEVRPLGQKYFINTYLYLPLKKAGETDDLNFSINYGAVYETIKEVVTNGNFTLLEGLAERICKVIFSSYPRVQKIQIRIKKPETTVPGILDCFGVEMERVRQG